MSVVVLELPVVLVLPVVVVLSVVLVLPVVLDDIVVELVLEDVVLVLEASVLETSGTVGLNSVTGGNVCFRVVRVM